MFNYDVEGSTKHRPNDEPPEGTAHFVVYHKGITTSERDDEGGLVMYAPGDELPHDLAHKVWEVFGDRIAAFAPHGGRLDQPVGGDAEQDTSGLQEWLASRGDDGPPYTCETCGKAFPSSAAWQGHQHTHADPEPDRGDDGPPYTCETCGKVFDTISAYHGHQSVHSDARDDTEPEDPPDAADPAGGATPGGDAA